MRFEKWQALGNDYVITEERDLTFELTPERVRRLCEPHTGIGSDGLLVISESEREGAIAKLRIFNADGSEAELSGNGAREAILYLRHSGWADQDSFAIETAAGEISQRITGRTTCSIAMGMATLRSRDFPSGPPDGRGTLTAAGEDFSFQHVSIGNPQCAIEVGDRLDQLDLARYGPPIERHELFPNRTNVSFWRHEGGGRRAGSELRARIFERGVGETLSSGTGASGAAVAAVVAGAASPVTVHMSGGDLEVEVSDALEVSLSGWAVPVYRGELSDDLVSELNASE